MSLPEAVHSGAREWVKFAVGLASGALGLAGTWMMSRRYAKQFGRAVVYSLFGPLLALFGKGQRMREVLEEDAKDNSDLPDSLKDMVLGLVLLFWSFFLQLVLPWFDVKF